jgi:tRNA (guanine-N7-)-methyltransferase
MMYLPLSEAIRRYTVPWLSLDWPLDWPQIFGWSGDLVVEIGFGNGGFLADLAQEHPDKCFVGIERAWGSISRLFKRLETQGLDHVRAMEGDAAFMLDHLFAPQSLSQVFINFSDPWHKERHHGRRLIQDGFVQMLAERLKLGGEVTIATDHAAYAIWIADVLERQSRLQSVYATTSVNELPERKATKYEKKAIAEGLPIHYFVWRQNANLSLDAPSEKVDEMPNVILQGEYNRENLLLGVDKKVWQEIHGNVSVVIKLMEVYGHLKDGHRLVGMMVREGELAQYFGISILFRKDNQLLVKLSSIGHPRPTWGVKLAVKKVADLILETHSELRMVSSTVGH